MLGDGAPVSRAAKVDRQFRIRPAGLGSAKPITGQPGLGDRLRMGRATERAPRGSLVIEAFQISEVLRIKRQKDLRHEYQELRIKFARIASLLVQKDPNLHR